MSTKKLWPIRFGRRFVHFHLDCRARKSDKKVKVVKKACQGGWQIPSGCPPRLRVLRRLASKWVRPARGLKTRKPWVFIWTFVFYFPRRKSETGPVVHFLKGLYTLRPSLGVSLFLRQKLFSKVLGKSLKMGKTSPGPPPRQGLPLLFVVSGKPVNPRGGGLVRSLTTELLLHAFLTPFTFLSLFLARQSRPG